MDDLQTGTALALPEPTTLATMFRASGGMETLISRIEAEARSHAPDLTTKKGRDAIKSLAYRVAQSKTALDMAGKDLSETARAQINAVDAERRKVRDRLDALKDEVRKPLDDWEVAEAKRIDALKLRLTAFRPSHVPASSEGLRTLIAEIEAVTIDAAWQEFQTEATEAKALCLNRLDEHLQTAVAREEAAALAERQAAELEQLRREKAERDEADRLRAEAEVAEARRIEAEKLEAERKRIATEQAAQAQLAAEKAEADRLAQIERDKREAAQIAAKQAEERAKAEADRAAKEASDREAALKRQAEEIEARHLQQLAEAKAREAAAAQAERDRIAAERQAEADARVKREADSKHRAKIHSEIAAALATMAGSATPEAIATALMDGKIPNVKVTL